MKKIISMLLTFMLITSFTLTSFAYTQSGTDYRKLRGMSYSDGTPIYRTSSNSPLVPVFNYNKGYMYCTFYNTKQVGATINLDFDNGATFQGCRDMFIAIVSEDYSYYGSYYVKGDEEFTTIQSLSPKGLQTIYIFYSKEGLDYYFLSHTGGLSTDNGYVSLNKRYSIQGGYPGFTVYNTGYWKSNYVQFVYIDWSTVVSSGNYYFFSKDKEFTYSNLGRWALVDTTGAGYGSNKLNSLTYTATNLTFTENEETYYLIKGVKNRIEYPILINFRMNSNIYNTLGTYYFTVSSSAPTSTEKPVTVYNPSPETEVDDPSVQVPTGNTIPDEEPTPSPSPSTAPSGNGGGNSGSGTDDGGGGNSGVLDGIGSAVGSVISGLLSFISSLLSSILGGLTSLVTSVIDGITDLVGNFDGFTDLLSSLFGFLPEEVVSVMVIGVSLSFIRAILKIFK